MNALDIAFILDSSSQIETSTNFNLIKEFAINVMQLYDVSTSVRLSVMTFSSVASIRWNFLAFSTQEALQEQIAALQFEGGDSNMTAALTLARQSLFTFENGDRPDVPNIAIMILGSRPSNRCQNRAPPVVVEEALYYNVS